MSSIKLESKNRNNGDCIPGMSTCNLPMRRQVEHWLKKIDSRLALSDGHKLIDGKEETYI